jgi:hypothetical protein
MRQTTIVVLLGALLSIPVSANQGRKSFIESWQGRRVGIKRTLFTLVYDEHGKLGKTYHGKREGLTVVTPSSGVFLRFDGRDSEEDIVSGDPQQMVDMITAAYRRQSSLEIGFFQRIEPTVVARYEAGGVLVVKDVRIDRDRVRLAFARAADDAEANTEDMATALTVQWPIALSSGFTERPQIEDLIRQFVYTIIDTR